MTANKIIVFILLLSFCSLTSSGLKVDDKALWLCKEGICKLVFFEDTGSREYIIPQNVIDNITAKKIKDLYKCL